MSRGHAASRCLTGLAIFLLPLVAVSCADATPEGTLTFAMHFSPVPRWLDPGEGESTITPYLLLYALHDALLKPMPGTVSGLSMAESWSMAKDGQSAEFTLRPGMKFHNGDAVTAEDVKFSYERYRGGGAKVLKDNVKEIQVLGPTRVRFTFKEPWPDFSAFYGTFVTSAGWVVPKRYVERVGEEGYRKAPVGAGPYKFVSFNPGVELVLEAFEGYWRKTPSLPVAVRGPEAQASVVRDASFGMCAGKAPGRAGGGGGLPPGHAATQPFAASRSGHEIGGKRLRQSAEDTVPGEAPLRPRPCPAP